MIGIATKTCDYVDIEEVKINSLRNINGFRKEYIFYYFILKNEHVRTLKVQTFSIRQGAIEYTQSTREHMIMTASARNFSEFEAYINLIESRRDADFNRAPNRIPVDNSFIEGMNRSAQNRTWNRRSSNRYNTRLISLYNILNDLLSGVQQPTNNFNRSTSQRQDYVRRITDVITNNTNVQSTVADVTDLTSQRDRFQTERD